MEQNLIDINGMTAEAAKEYLFALICTLKLTEKQVQEIDEELRRWNARIELAKSRGLPDLASEAEQEAGRTKSGREQLAGEIAGLKSQIEEIRRGLPLLAARQRAVDPDLLEQELLMAAGYLPGEEEKARKSRLFSDMEKEAAAEAALAKLKADMEKNI
jgi:phage shock protein A